MREKAKLDEKAKRESEEEASRARREKEEARKAALVALRAEEEEFRLEGGMKSAVPVKAKAAVHQKVLSTKSNKQKLSSMWLQKDDSKKVHHQEEEEAHNDKEKR